MNDNQPHQPIPQQIRDHATGAILSNDNTLVLRPVTRVKYVLPEGEVPAGGDLDRMQQKLDWIFRGVVK